MVVVYAPMAPRIQHGEYVVAEPNTEAQPGDEVLVKASDGGVMVRKFLYRRDGRIYLASVNAAHQPVAIAVVVRAQRPL